jgi:putative membrane protein
MNDEPVSLDRDSISTRLNDQTMMTNTTDQPLVWVVLALVATLIVFPVLTMGFGMMGAGPMMGGMWGDHMWGAGDASGWMLVIGAGMQLLFLAIIVGAIYFGYRAVSAQESSSDPALAELRIAYARGDLSDEEYKRRRERLEDKP